MKLKLNILALIIIGLVSNCVYAQDQASPSFSSTIDVKLGGIEVSFSQDSVTEKPKRVKLKAALLSILLGHFGVHRIYLGTSPNVPVIYSLTLGGGLGILPLADFIAIVSSPDVERYRNSNRVFMWLK